MNKGTDKNKEANVRKALEMLEYIVLRTGEDRASVFLDIIVQLIFGQDVHTFRNADDPSVRRQQQVLNEIANLFDISPPVLVNGPGEEDPNEIPF